MIRNRDFAMLYAGRAVFSRNGGYAGVAVGWNDMHGVISGVGHADGRGNVQAACIRGKHGVMKLVGMGDGLESVSSKIQRIWKH